MTQHTQAPWNYENGQITAEYGDRIATVFDGEHRPINESYYNGQLIAASPDLLSALVTLQEDCAAALSGEWDRSDKGFEAMLEVINGAISKAKGDA